MSEVDYRMACIEAKGFAHMLMQELEHIERHEGHPIMLMDYYRKRADELMICEVDDERLLD